MAGISLFYLSMTIAQMFLIWPQHEQASVMMLDHLIEENELMGEMWKYGLDENDITFIKELIVGPSKNANETPGRHVSY